MVRISASHNSLEVRVREASCKAADWSGGTWGSRSVARAAGIN